MTEVHGTPEGDVAGAAGAETAPADADVIDAEVVGEADEVGDVVDAEVVGEDGDTAEVAEPDPLSIVTAQRDEYLDSLRRLQAEFENYRKRVAKQQAEQVERAAVSLVDKVLPVLDALDLASAHLGDAESDDARALVAASGLLNDVLAKEGLERIDPTGEPFDPNAHEAVGHLPDEEGQVDDAEDADAGPVVAQVMRPGYRWRGTVVRPAMVMVRG